MMYKYMIYYYKLSSEQEEVTGGSKNLAEKVPGELANHSNEISRDFLHKLQ